MENDQLYSILLEKEVRMKALTLSPVDLEKVIYRHKVEDCLLMKTNVEWPSFPRRTSTSRSRGMDRPSRHIPDVRLDFAFNVEKTGLRYCRKDLSELPAFISELRRSFTRVNRDVDEI